MQPALNDITVLDFSHALSGPFATMLLAELGADVIKIEPPGGDHFRPANGGATFGVVNRNKRSVCIDLKNPHSDAIMARLIKRADVVVENFTPGTAERLGYGYAQVKALKADIIYASISGFGQSGPYREWRGYDAVAQAMSGMMAATGEADRAPVRVGPSMIDMGTGMYTVIGVQNALRERDRSGVGTYIDFNLFESALSWMSQGIARYSQTNVVPPRTGSALGAFSPYQVFNGRDGMLFIGASTERFWNRFCDALELQPLRDDPRFVDMQARIENRAVLTELVEQRLQQLPNDTALERLRTAGLPCAPVLDIGDVTRDEHVQARGVLHTIEDPDIGSIIQTNVPIGDGSPPQPAPQLGQHTREVMLELGFTANEIAAYCTNDTIREHSVG